jgi:hypothetical protein
MKKIIFYLMALIVMSFASCSLFEEDENELGGETSIPLNQVGNTFTSSVYSGDNYIDVPSSVEIISSKDGVVNLRIVADLSKDPSLSMINDLIPSTYKDSQGRVSTDIKYKVTSEGIQDYNNIDQKAHTLVKYDCEVGDKYTVSKSDGKTITREVTAKSDQDDFSWGWLMIKTITVEQDSRIPGISKIVYRLNHKFGLVYAEVVANDRSTISTYIFPANY